MQHILTLIADPSSPSLSEDHVIAAARVIVKAGGQSGAPAWLNPGVACDLPFAHPTPAAARSAVADALAGLALDIAAQPVRHRRKRLIVADMESTIIGQECLDELGEMIGRGAEIADITARAMRGELDFEAALRARVGMLAGLPVDMLERVWRERVRFNPGAQTLVKTMQAHGATTALVSGGFSFFTGRVAAAAGFHHHFANRLIIEQDALTGAVADPILGRDAKLETLQRLCGELGISAGEALAVGDGANDLAMIKAAGLGVAYHAKPVVAEAAHVRIDHGDLTALLYLQGYTVRDLVA